MDAALRDLLPDAAEVIDREDRRSAQREYPKPAATDILDLKQDLEAEWHHWRYGDEPSVGESGSTPPSGQPGLLRIREMRYHRDEMPEQWRRLLKSPARWRSHLIATEIARTVALATRNPPQLLIRPSSSDPDAQDAASQETRFWTHWLQSQERQSGQAILRTMADGLFEGGLGAVEVYTRTTYDHLDLEERLGEDEAAYRERTDNEMIRATQRYGTPIAIRPLDPLSVLLDLDDLGVRRALIVERASYRSVYRSLSMRYGSAKLEAMRLPKPGDHAWPDILPAQDATTSPRGLVDTVRYYDRYWYVYMVAGVIVDGPTPHGYPGVPVLPGFGDTTSSAHLSERYQGVVAGMVEQEQAINDAITAAIDIGMTFGRPKVGIERESMAPGDNDPVSVDLSDPSQIPRLRPGEKFVDLFKDFESRIPPELISLMLGIRQQVGINPIVGGESPGSDPSGYAVNSLQSASMMRYEIFLDNYARWIGQIIDFVRRTIKYGDNLNDRMFVPVESQGLVEYLGLGPDDISDMPCIVSIDPTTDVNRMAQRQSLIAAHQGRYISRRVVQEQGFGVEDVDRMNDEILEDMAEMQLEGMALEVAKQRILGQIAQIGQSPIPSPEGDEAGGLVGPNGQPLRSEPRPPSVGREMAAASARGRGGQQPTDQGVQENVPVGAP